MSIVSSQSQLERMQKVLSNYLRLPFSDQTIPGTIMEHVLAFVRDAEVLNTYGRQKPLQWLFLLFCNH